MYVAIIAVGNKFKIGEQGPTYLDCGQSTVNMSLLQSKGTFNKTSMRSVSDVGT